MIRVKDLDYSYGDDVKVLQKFNLSVEAGEIIAIMGASGSGKSTLMDIIGGLKEPQKGVVFVYGQNLYDMSDKEVETFKLSNMGYIFQNYNLVPFLNVYENVLLPAMILNVRDKALEMWGNELLIRLGIENKKNRMPGELSGGERQRVAIARALIMSPKVVLADEPTGALDSGNTKVFMEYFIKMIKGMESSALVVTHDERVARYCDKTIKLSEEI